MTKEVQIPFLSRFEQAMLTGKKTWTSRTRKYGEVGDTFKQFGAVFKIEQVFQMSLDVIAYLHHKEEGIESPEAFMKGWATIHPRKGYVPEQKVWVHVFKRVEEAQKT